MAACAVSQCSKVFLNLLTYLIAPGASLSDYIAFEQADARFLMEQTIDTKSVSQLVKAVPMIGGAAGGCSGKIEAWRLQRSPQLVLQASDGTCQLCWSFTMLDEQVTRYFLCERTVSGWQQHSVTHGDGLQV